MKIIIDSNILFSALIKDSTTRKLILEYDDFFLFPSFIFEEMENHKQELMQKSKMDSGDFERLLQLLLKKCFIVPQEVLTTYREKALGIVQNIDPDDAVFIACAMAYPKSVIWSDDQKLKEQNEVKIINTTEMMEYLEDI
ncbi:MAG: PIN domain-containing protein [Nanoarchaeota archaeon]